MVIKSRRITWALQALYLGYKSPKNLTERRHYVGGNIKMVTNKHDATV